MILEKIIIRATFLNLLCIGLFQLNCSSQNIKDDSVFVVATYDDVKDWDPATA